jgi:hypothetical protein
VRRSSRLAHQQQGQIAARNGDQDQLPGPLLKPDVRLLVVQNHIEQRTVDLQATIVVNESELAAKQPSPKTSPSFKMATTASFPC